MLAVFGSRYTVPDQLEPCLQQNRYNHVPDEGDYFWYTPKNRNVYFAGKPVSLNGVGVLTDRLGSVRVNGNGERFNYYPYGAERGTTADGTEKFGTYFRDAGGMDYADQRYYQSAVGRFTTPDPSRASGGPADPGSWNRYSYVGGDPVNGYDPRGLDTCKVNGEEEYQPACLTLKTPGPVLYWYLAGTTFESDDEQGKSGDQITLPGLGGPATKDQKKKFGDAMKDAVKKLGKDRCAGLFGGGTTGLDTLLHSTFTLAVSFEEGSVIPSEATFATTELKGGKPTGNVTINMIGHFFNTYVETTVNGQPAIADWTTGTGLGGQDFRAFVLLHELGHLTGKLGDDRKNTQLSDTFNQQILKDCFGKK